jgi:hypothetical protein
LKSLLNYIKFSGVLNSGKGSSTGSDPAF